MDKWVSFFAPHFADQNATENFVSKCESLTPSDSNHIAKIMMHQTQRLVSLADEIVKVRPRESLQLLFLMICAENISKLHDGYEGDKDSKKYVKKFFSKYLSEPDKEKLQRNFNDNKSMALDAYDFEKVIDLLYDVRCDVVHEGKMWDFNFSHNDHIPVVNADPDVTVHLTLAELRDIIVRGCITAIKEKLKS